MFKISIHNEKNNIIGKFIVDSYFFDSSKYEYAFYLHNNGKKIEVKWYTKSMEAAFDIGDSLGVFQIKGFIRDIENRDTRSFKSEMLSIH